MGARAPMHTVAVEQMVRCDWPYVLVGVVQWCSVLRGHYIRHNRPLCSIIVTIIRKNPYSETCPDPYPPKADLGKSHHVGEHGEEAEEGFKGRLFTAHL